jgi:hypothetical protein
MSKTFIISWDNLGVEAVIDVDAMEQDELVALLKQNFDTPYQPARGGVALSRYVNMMLLRAKANPQRHYEIYTIQTDDNISADDIKTMFEDSPQTSADLIRARGNKIYSNRFKPDQVKIF